MTASTDQRFEQLEIRMAYLERTLEQLDDQVRLAFDRLDEAASQVGTLQELLRSIMERLEDSA